MSMLDTASDITYFEIKNDGPLVIFLHGFPNNHLVFKEQYKAMKGFHIISFNLPGALEKKRLTKDLYSLERISNAILQVLEGKEVLKKDLFLVGHDLGCFILDEISRNLKLSVRGQVFISGMGLGQYRERLNSMDQLKKSYYAFLFQIPGVADLARFLQKPLRKYVYKISNISSSSLYDEAPEGFGSIYLYPELGKRLFLASSDLSSVPTQFIWGDGDRFLNPPAEPEMSRFYKNGRISILKGGHWVLREKAQEINEIILNFLTSNMPQKSVAHENYI